VDNYGGIYLCGSLNVVSENYISNGATTGIHVGEYFNNTIILNVIVNNSLGIGLERSSDNVIYHNCFLDNERQARQYVFDPTCSNHWNAGYPSGGNYWSDYNGSDSYSGSHQNDMGSDGIGDSPYVIDASNQDKYPLMNPYVPFENQAIYVRANGNIDPSGAPIQREGESYTLLRDINSNADGIIVERSSITIDGNGHMLRGSENGTGFSLSGVGNVTIRNTTITSFYCGIKSNGSFGNFLTGNSLTNNGYGIYLNSSSENSLSGNNITTNRYEGIRLLYSSNNSITENNMTDNGGGMSFDYSSNNTLSGNKITASFFTGIDLFYSPNNIFRNNTMVGNKYNFGYTFFSSQQIDLSNFINDIDVSNTINGKPVIYLISKQNSIISPQTYPSIGYLAVVNSTNITVRDLEMEDNGQGILFAYTNNSSIENVTTRNNRAGIRLSYSSNNIIARNNITASANYDGIILDISCDNNLLIRNNITNNYEGVFIYESSNNSIVENDIAYNNPYGLRLQLSQNNSIYHNNFINNTSQVSVWDSSTNSWDDGYPSGGNYWSNHTGVDLDSGSNQNETGSDSIGDAPHVIDENNTDRYPLMAPYSAFDAGTWNETPYDVDVVSNSTVSDFHLNPQENCLEFNVTGQEGTTGFCRVAIPKDLLWAEDWQWVVLVGGVQVTSNVTSDENCAYLYFNYNHSTKTVRVQGTHVIPELPSTTITRLLMILAMLATALATIEIQKEARKLRVKPLQRTHTILEKQYHTSPNWKKRGCAGDVSTRGGEQIPATLRQTIRMFWTKCASAKEKKREILLMLITNNQL